MKQVMAGAVACIAAFGGTGGSSAIADDRELQAILVKQGCVAEAIDRTESSSVVSAYDVTCRGSGRVLTIVCVDSDCRLQSAPRHDQRRQEPAGPLDG